MYQFLRNSAKRSQHPPRSLRTPMNKGKSLGGCLANIPPTPDSPSIKGWRPVEVDVGIFFAKTRFSRRNRTYRKYRTSRGTRKTIEYRIPINREGLRNKNNGRNFQRNRRNFERNAQKLFRGSAHSSSCERRKFFTYTAYTCLASDYQQVLQ